MSELEALLLGIVQGLTEFLPISSSGHLVLVPWLTENDFLRENPDFNTTFDVALHAGTLIAAVAYFRREVVALTAGFLAAVRERSIASAPQRLSVAIAIGTIPAFVAGGLGSDLISDHLGEPWMIAIQLAFFGLLLLLADRLPQRRSLDDASVRDGLYIGLAQILALAPGTSRSGITITAARYLGLDRDSAARFSFLMLIPVVAGATLYEGVGVVRDGLPEGVVGPMIVGMAAAAASGYLAIVFLLRLVRTMSYRPFVYYRFALAAAILLVIGLGLRSATF